jgi:hypothetical protein
MKQKYENLRAATEKMDKTNEQRVKELKSQLSRSQADRDKLIVELNSATTSSTTTTNSSSKAAAGGGGGSSTALSATETAGRPAFNEEAQALIFSLKNENADLKLKLKNMGKQFENKCEELIAAEAELKKLRAVHQERVTTSERQLVELRTQLREATGASERRIGELEASLAEMCAQLATSSSSNSSSSSHSSVGSLDKVRLRSTSNATATRQSTSLASDTTSQPNLDFDAALEQITTLKAYIESTARELNINFSFNGELSFFY